MRPLARLKAYDGLTAETARVPLESNELGDLRFRALMSDADWAALPLAIRRRFSKRLADGNTAVYVGEVLETQMSRAGFLLRSLQQVGVNLSTSEECDSNGHQHDYQCKESDGHPCRNSLPSTARHVNYRFPLIGPLR